MRSIRLSLIAYFLGLLVLALGVASWLVYNSAHATLRDKERATEQLIEARRRERDAEEEKRLNDRLLQQAFTLAKLVRVEFNGVKLLYNRYRGLQMLGALSAVRSPMGHLTAAPWLVQSAREPRGWVQNLPPFP